jgi:hypothetical protein
LRVQNIEGFKILEGSVYLTLHSGKGAVYLTLEKPAPHKGFHDFCIVNLDKFFVLCIIYIIIWVYKIYIIYINNNIKDIYKRFVLKQILKDKYIKIFKKRALKVDTFYQK